MPGMSDNPQPPHVLAWRKILNEHWPARPAEFKDHWPGIPVMVRVMWEEFGEEWLPGVAKRWDAGHVYVEAARARPERFMNNGVWVKPEDVRRVRPAEPDTGHEGTAPATGSP